MELEERIALFYGMFSANYPVYRWHCTAEGLPVWSNCPEYIRSPELTEHLGLGEALRTALRDDGALPFLVESRAGFLWLACPVSQEGGPGSVQLFGPVFAGANSPLTLRRRLDQQKLPAGAHTAALRFLEEMPVVPYSILTQYGVMLYYAVTGGHIGAADIRMVSAAGEAEEESAAPLSTAHSGVWAAERELTRAIREGNLSYRTTLQRSMGLSTGVHMEVGDPLRSAKNNVLVLLVLASRAAIEGGLSPEISYTLNDFYAERIERAANLAALSSLSAEMLDDFVRRVNRLHLAEGVSPAVLDACDYISLHLEEPLTIALLAGRAGYTPYYFSARFKAETGLSVSAYLSAERIRRAAELLLDTTLSVSEIQERLGFSSRSRFYELFRRQMGLAPAAYRARRGS